jgi:hypothetical protein
MHQRASVQSTRGSAVAACDGRGVRSSSVACVVRMCAAKRIASASVFPCIRKETGSDCHKKHRATLMCVYTLLHTGRTTQHCDIIMVFLELSYQASYWALFVF